MTPIRSILIALPTVSRFMKATTAIAVANTVRELQRRGVHVDLHNIDSAEIVTARDMFGNMLLHSSTWDAMLFVDSDMGFEPRLVTRMLDLGVEVAAAACPRRSMDLERLVIAANQHGTLDKARSLASSFTVMFDWDYTGTSPSRVENGFAPAAAVGMAVALIRKSALVAMVEAGVTPPRLDLNASGGGTCWSFFGIVEDEGHRLGEDYSFCYRWTKLMGRELHVCVDEQIQHLGDYTYTARFADTLG